MNDEDLSKWLDSFVETPSACFNTYGRPPYRLLKLNPPSTFSTCPVE